MDFVQQALGTTPGVFIGVTILVMGFAAFMTGQALAHGWRPAWQVALYAPLLGLADRFLVFALFQGALLSPTGYLIDTAVLGGIALFSHRLNRARRMVAQYPWLYERAGLLGYRPRGGERV